MCSIPQRPCVLKGRAVGRLGWEHSLHLPGPGAPWDRRVAVRDPWPLGGDASVVSGMLASEGDRPLPFPSGACRTGLREVGGSEPRHRFSSEVALTVCPGWAGAALRIWKRGSAPAQGGGDTIYSLCGRPTNESNVCDPSGDQGSAHLSVARPRAICSRLGRLWGARRHPSLPAASPAPGPGAVAG